MDWMLWVSELILVNPYGLYTMYFNIEVQMYIVLLVYNHIECNNTLYC